jgi:hypothetical protein
LEFENFNLLLSNIDLLNENRFFNLGGFHFDLSFPGLSGRVDLGLLLVTLAIGIGGGFGFFFDNNLLSLLDLGGLNVDISGLAVDLFREPLAFIQKSCFLSWSLSSLGKSAGISSSLVLKSNLAFPFGKLLSLQFKVSLSFLILLSNLF